MVNLKIINTIKTVLNLLLIVLMGIFAIIFSILYVDTFKKGFLFNYYELIKCIIVGFISILVILTIIFYKYEYKIVYKFFSLLVVFISCVCLILYLLKLSGFLDKVDTIEDFRRLIDSFGGFAIIAFILIQFLQVVFLPIPGFVAIGTGVLSFGLWWGALYSFIGIFCGSIVAFFIGKKFGYKVTSWVIGKDKLNKWLNLIKGKDKFVLSVMFLFPFFPDDLLCFVAGLSTMKNKYFFIMIAITRSISIITTSLSINNNIIPYTTWWGILIWITLIAVIAIISWLFYKNGEKIEDYLKNKFAKKIKE